MKDVVKVQKAQFAKFVRKFRIQPNSIIAFSHGSITQEGVDGLADAIKQIGIPGVVLLVVDDVNQMTFLDEKAMNELGWFKLSQINNFIKKVQTNGKDDKPVSLESPNAEDSIGENQGGQVQQS